MRFDDYTATARQVVREANDAARESGHAQLSAEQILSAREVVNQVYVDGRIKDYIVRIVFATRRPEDYGLRDLRDMIEYGASPRASINLTLAAKAHAFLNHRGYVTPEDIKAIGYDVLRHRVILSYEAEAEELKAGAEGKGAGGMGGEGRAQSEGGWFKP